MDPLQVLIIEDSGQDAAPIERELVTLCAEVDVSLVTSETRVCAALEGRQPDLVLMDAAPRGCSALETLAVLRQRWPEVPVIVVSGSVGEECAAELLRAGANDFVLKSNLARLGPVVERELTATHLRRQTQEAERQRRKTDERYRRLIETAEEGVWEVDSAMRTTFANRRLAEMLGTSPEAMLGLVVDSFVHPDERADHAAKILQRRQGQAGRYERRLVRADGSDLWALVAATPILGPNGEFQGALAMLTDITDRKLAQDALRASEERYRVLVEAAGEGICIAQSGRLRFVNRRLCEMTGHSREELLAMDLAERIHPEDREMVLARHRARLAGEEVPQIYDFRFITKGGETRWAQNCGTVVTWDNRPATLNFLVDVTARKHAERELSVRSAALEAAANPILILDSQGIVEWANPAFTSLTGRSLGDVVGKPLREIQPGQTGHGGEMDIWKAMALGRVWRGEVPSKRRDGTSYIERTTLTPVRDESGAVTHYIAIREDVTEQREREQQRFQALKMEAIGRLAGGVAHDYNNTLQAILSLAQVLRLTENDAKRKRRLLDIEEHVQRGAQLARQLLLFSRRETSRPERLDLGDVVEAATNLVRRVVRENVQLSVERAKDPVPVVADRGQLEQVVVNLAMNGAEAMPGGGRLVVKTAACQPDWASLEVEDTGSGIAPEIRPHIFEPFFSTRGSGRGTGLGLAVVEGIVRGLGGRIEVDTEVGRGTRFRILIPLAAGTGADDLDTALPVEDMPPCGAHEKVVLIEDEAGAREGLAEALTMLGYDVTAVGSAEEALALPTVPAMEALISDLALPGASGAEVARELSGRWPGLAVILMSGYVDDETVQKQARDGSLRFLPKPFETARVAEELRAALAASKGRNRAAPAAPATGAGTGPETVSGGGDDGT
ncbi:MAG TPA: PAS domain S-box protein [Thermoanaerobaculaceae bacterium]|nr:PAS domain S-box protein [Thermoanaerobaculaceae bacterium]HRS15950.1 PAS domain S-box protein [Thermoanaerobaculaceae bacterium]